VEKPSPAFFARLVELAGEPRHAIAYVGDRVDNDIVPAADAGMVTVFVRRGPWGEVHARRPEAARADIQVDGLTAAAEALIAWGR
jgi:FMN phosphatase YigB (HAD superfamily)